MCSFVKWKFCVFRYLAFMFIYVMYLVRYLGFTFMQVRFIKWWIFVSNPTGNMVRADCWLACLILQCSAVIYVQVELWPHSGISSMSGCRQSLIAGSNVKLDLTASAILLDALSRVMLGSAYGNVTYVGMYSRRAKLWTLGSFDIHL